MMTMIEDWNIEGLPDFVTLIYSDYSLSFDFGILIYRFSSGNFTSNFDDKDYEVINGTIYHIY